MLFPGFPFPSYMKSFPYHYDVLKYLQEFASHYELNQFIKFGVHVEQIQPIPIGSDDSNSMTNKNVVPQDNGISFHNWGRFRDTVRWRVVAKDSESGQVTSEDYDAVLVCNGYVVLILT